MMTTKIGKQTYVRWRVNFSLTWPWPSQPAVGHLQHNITAWHNNRTLSNPFSVRRDGLSVSEFHESRPPKNVRSNHQSSLEAPRTYGMGTKQSRHEYQRTEHTKGAVRRLIKLANFVGVPAWFSCQKKSADEIVEPRHTSLATSRQWRQKQWQTTRTPTLLCCLIF